MAVALVAVAGGLATVGFTRVGRDDDRPRSAERPAPTADREGSILLPASAPGVVVASPPAAYQLTYAIEDWAGGDRIVTTDTLLVQRPYRGRAESRAAGTAGSAALRTRTVTDFGRVSIGGRDAAELLVDTPPALAASDLRLDVVLADAESAGLLTRRERRRVAGEPCVVVRTREPIASGTLLTDPPTAGEYTDTCVGASGLVLEELWVTGGRVLRRRLATSVELDPRSAADASTFAAFGRRLEPKQGGGSIRGVDPATRPAGAPFWEGVTVPAGFAYRGRFAVVPPQRSVDVDPGELASNPLGSSNGKRIGAVVDVWERGIDVLLLEQGASVDSRAVFDLVKGAPTVDVEGLGTGSVVLDGRLDEIRFPLPSGRFVRVLGTLRPAELEAAIGSLRDVGEGTGLQYLEG